MLEGHDWRCGGNWNLVLVGNAAACVGGCKLMYLSVFSGCGKGLLGEEDEFPESVGKDQIVDLEVNKEEGEKHNNNCEEDEDCVVFLVIGRGAHVDGG